MIGLLPLSILSCVSLFGCGLWAPTEKFKNPELESVQWGLQPKTRWWWHLAFAGCPASTTQPAFDIRFAMEGNSYSLHPKNAVMPDGLARYCSTDKSIEGVSLSYENCTLTDNSPPYHYHAYLRDDKPLQGDVCINTRLFYGNGDVVLGEFFHTGDLRVPRAAFMSAKSHTPRQGP